MAALLGDGGMDHLEVRCCMPQPWSAAVEVGVGGANTGRNRIGPAPACYATVANGLGRTHVGKLRMRSGLPVMAIRPSASASAKTI